MQSVVAAFCKAFAVNASSPGLAFSFSRSFLPLARGLETLGPPQANSNMRCFMHTSSMPSPFFQPPHRPVGLRNSLRSAAAAASAPLLVAETWAAKPQHETQVGRVELIMGPMFAGKSTELLSRVRQERSAGRRVLVIKPEKDTRSSHELTTHTGDSIPCLTASNLLSFRSTTGAAAYHDADVLAIDEAQFFSDLVDFVQQAADLHQKIVYVSGLDGDFKRRRFGQILDLVPLADSVTKLGCKCQFCDRKSLFSLRIVDEESVELVGGADKYVPTCRTHYLELSKTRS